MSDEPLVSDIKSEDVISDEHSVSYDISEIGLVLSELNNISTALAALKKNFSQIETAIIQSRMSLHKVSEEGLP
tara:strand:- start:1035 stop:1256 length:222 start_codon:yes stop_codon:yes gene_type:complete